MTQATADFTQRDVQDEIDAAAFFNFIVATTHMPAARVHAMNEQAKRHTERAEKIRALLPPE